jgi:hypothetical protein
MLPAVMIAELLLWCVPLHGLAGISSHIAASFGRLEPWALGPGMSLQQLHCTILGTAFVPLAGMLFGW